MRLVQKYGGTSVADISRLENVALRIKKTVDSGHQVAVVVSAMAGVTNQLVSYTKAFSSVMNGPDHDAVLATGEQITTGLLSLALQQLGLKSRSFMGWQVPIYTTKHHTDAHIRYIPPDTLESCFTQGIIPVIAGFQGITDDHHITTLGRGGSDTTAVAIATAIRADRCDIYTDVDGVYTADPSLIPTARKLTCLGYDEMLELAEQGAKVLHSRCVALALRDEIPLRVCSSFTKDPGTDIIASPPSDQIRGITHSDNWVKVYLVFEEIKIKTLDLLKKILDDLELSIDFLSILDIPPSPCLHFLVKKIDFAKTIQALEKNHPYILYKDLSAESDFSKLSIIGGGLQENKMLMENVSHITSKGQNELIYSSPVRISLSVKQKQAIETLRTLHTQLSIGS